MYVALMSVPWVNENFALYNIGSNNFQPYQLLTHMFMHSSQSFTHILMNMFGLVMFGSVVEKQIGAKKFLILYFVSAIGAMAFQLGLNYYNFYSYFQNYDTSTLDLIKNEAQKVVYNKSYPVEVLEFYYYDIARMVGASGAIMGVLVAFAYYNPNTELMLIFLPVPIKAKFFIPIYMLLELFLGVGNFQWDNIAHWAHLGGALAGFLLVYFWKKDRSNFY
jgi:rhomboid-like protein